VLASNAPLAAAMTLDIRIGSTCALLLLALRDPQLADRAHEILFRGAPKLSAEERARSVTRLSIVLCGELTISSCPRLVTVGGGECVFHRRNSIKLAGPPAGCGEAGRVGSGCLKDAAAGGPHPRNP